jgi:predicted helicase
VCDEAHRTTGVTLSGDDETAFVKVHNQGFIKGKKRLYMTATPKVFSDASSKKAEDAGAVLADMGKPDMFGEEFHRLGFGEAVERGILTDYKVLVLAVDEAYVARRFQRQFADDDNELKLEDAAKIVGCWNGLSKRSTEQEEFQIDPGSMKRAVAFARSIAESKKIASMFQAVVDEETAQLDDDEAEYLRCEVEHVDGSFNSLRRNEKLDWLRQEVPDNTARILSNARCLTEGVDVPALDAVMFLNPRDSQVDVVQAVGRVMRKLEGKKYGYVILPIGVPADMDPATALNDNKKYKVVWQVLQALRSHDERFDAMVNKIDLTKKAPQIGIIGVGGGAGGDGKDENGSVTLDFPNFDQWRDAILAKIVQKVGEKRYWENWAKDVSVIANAHLIRITELVEDSSGLLESKFKRFLRGLRDNINPSISKSDAIEMLAQHLITQPIFDALFGDNNFSDSNPVSLVMDEMTNALHAHNFDYERGSLNKFYESVQNRARGLDSPEARQKIIKQLYEEFFSNAFPETSDRLGIVYTPIEIVDFINESAALALKEHFGVSLSDEDVHVLDPFTGTGTFIVRLIEAGLIRPEDLLRKFRHELHANEIVLLAYYVAAVNIESAYQNVSGASYEPFKGVVLTDTFQIGEDDDSLDELSVFPENNERVVHQKALDIRVIVGNPPYSDRQRNAGDGNQNLKYHSLDARIAQTYVAESSSTTRTSAYDSYVRAIRWASDRIGDAGIIAFVTNNSFLDSKSLDGLRKVLVREFDSIEVVNLRGNLRLSGEAAKKEGGNVFDVRVGIAIWLAIRGGQSVGARLKYWETPDGLDKPEKLAFLKSVGRAQKIDSKEITPNANGDWINQRTEHFSSFLPLIAAEKKPVFEESIFLDRTSGLATKRDAWNWNFSRDELSSNISSLVEKYNKLVHEMQTSGASPDSIVKAHPEFPWVQNTIRDLGKGRLATFSEEAIRRGMYRPFTRKWVYTQRQLIWSRYSTERLFPRSSSNFAIAITGPGASQFSVFAVDSLPDYNFMHVGIFLPRFLGPANNSSESALFEENPRSAISNYSKVKLSESFGVELHDDDVFAYVYGILNNPHFVQQYKADLVKVLPRIPLIEEFQETIRIGKQLLALHLGFDDLEGFPLGLPKDGASGLGFLRAGRTIDKSRVVADGGHVSIPIPEDANLFKVGAKTPLEWVIQSSSSSRDAVSGIEQNPSDWEEESGEATNLVGRAERAVELAISSAQLIRQLPKITELPEILET